MAGRTLAHFAIVFYIHEEPSHGFRDPPSMVVSSPLTSLLQPVYRLVPPYFYAARMLSWSKLQNFIKQSCSWEFSADTCELGYVLVNTRTRRQGGPVYRLVDDEQSFTDAIEEMYLDVVLTPMRDLVFHLWNPKPKQPVAVTLPSFSYLSWMLELGIQRLQVLPHRDDIRYTKLRLSQLVFDDLEAKKVWRRNRNGSKEVERSG